MTRYPKREVKARSNACVGIPVTHEFEGPVVRKGYAVATVRYVKSRPDFMTVSKVSCKYTTRKGQVKRSEKTVVHEGFDEPIWEACAMVKRRCKR